MTSKAFYNSLAPSIEYSIYLTNLFFIYKFEGIIKKISYERCVYESVDDMNVSWDIFHKFTEAELWSQSVISMSV